MTNNFSTVKTNLSSEKISLVRIQGAREVGVDLSLDSGTTYTHTFHVQALQKIVVDGVVYTKVSSSPFSTEYTYNESTKLLTINLGTAYVSQQVVVFFYLFYSKDQTRIAPETPTDSASTERPWFPRLVNTPSTSVDFKNITDGRLQFSSSAIRLHNQDHDFEQYLGDRDSFANKKITVWTAIDGVENIRVSFEGKISKIEVDTEVLIDFDSNFALLDQTFFSNGSYLSSTFNSSKFPNMDRTKENEPIRKLYSEVTTYSVVEEDVSKLLYKPSQTLMLRAVCTDFDDEILTTTNREWGTVLGEGDNGDQTDTVQSIDHTDVDYSLIGFTSGKKYRIGDTLLINTFRVQVKYVDNIANKMRVTKNASIVTTETITRKGVSTIVIEQSDVNYFPLYDRDYTLSVGTNNAILVTFVDNFEATLGMTSLDPNIDNVHFRAWGDTTKSYQHGDVIKDVLETIGFTVNAASITAANLTSLETNFYIPFIEESAFPTFGNIVEAILASTLSYMSLNNDLEIEYVLFDTPSPAVAATRDDDDIIKESTNIEIDYTQMYNSITPMNKHDVIDLTYTNVGFESNKATYLHEVKKNREFTHILANPDRTQQVLNIISERKLLYRYEVKAIDLESIIGDDYQLAGIILAGNVPTKDVTILEINKRTETVIITASDLLGL